jgi:hypothetical protein
VEEQDHRREETGAEEERVTPERQLEIKARLDQRFDQFSLEEAQRMVSGEMTFRQTFPGFSIWEQEFTEDYFNEKRDGLLRDMQGEKLPNEAQDKLERTGQYVHRYRRTIRRRPNADSRSFSGRNHPDNSR